MFPNRVISQFRRLRGVVATKNQNHSNVLHALVNGVHVLTRGVQRWNTISTVSILSGIRLFPRLSVYRCWKHAPLFSGICRWCIRLTTATRYFVALSRAVALRRAWKTRSTWERNRNRCFLSLPPTIELDARVSCIQRTKVFDGKR